MPMAARKRTQFSGERPGCRTRRHTVRLHSSFPNSEPVHNQNVSAADDIAHPPPRRLRRGRQKWVKLSHCLQLSQWYSAMGPTEATRCI